MESVSTTVAAENTTYQQIINNVKQAVEMLEKSSFFADFMKQMRDPEIVEQIERVTEHSKLQVVLYGVGEMEASDYIKEVEVSHLQLAFTILLKEKFRWVNDIVVYDPRVSPLQQKAISAFDCTFLRANENGRRTVERPTLFFLPHCPATLVNNILSANWTTANLNKIIILGYSFRAIKNDIINCRKVLRPLKHLMAIIHSDRIVREMPLPEPEILEQSALYRPGVYRTAFGEFSWHFFPSDGSLEDLNMNMFPEVIES